MIVQPVLPDSAGCLCGRRLAREHAVGVVQHHGELGYPEGVAKIGW